MSLHPAFSYKGDGFTADVLASSHVIFVLLDAIVGAPLCRFDRSDGALAVSMAMHTDDLSSDDDEENRNTVGRGEAGKYEEALCAYLPEPRKD